MLEYLDRRGTDCFKWDGQTANFGEEGLLALWVADMDFRVDSHITDALRKYIDEGVPGYYKVPDSYYDAFIGWERTEHGLDVDREWIRFSPGVVTGFHMALQAVTEPGDAVIITTPVYYPFMHAIKANGRKMVMSELVCGAGGRYVIDFDDFGRKVKEENVKAFILCSPHNPVSRVWEKDELERMLEICRENGVTVISDEIHHDLVFGGCRHIPTLSIAEPDDKIIMLTAASKTFNIAGLQNSFVVIKDPDLRAAWNKVAGGVNIGGGNAMGYIACEAAYRFGKPWLEEVREAVIGNYNFMKEELLKAMPDLKIPPLEGTYLAWVDFGAYLKPEEIKPFIQDKCGLAVDFGSWFGGSGSGSCIRVNLATSRENIVEMVRRILSNRE
ncbi:MAG: pyridoxal phosphate-dependent aminotransferase [Mogibacterium sp.]|nr:pyridoxal phosphate-dependent aminotransferase [Mogibacterium sp.]